MQIKTTIGYIFFNHKTGRGLKIDNGAGKDWEFERDSFTSGRG